MRKNDEAVKSKNPVSFAFVIHCMLGVVVCLIFSFIFSALVSGEKLPASSIMALSCVSVFIGACLAGVLSAAKFRRNLITSLLQGIFFFVVLYIIGALLYGRWIPSSISPAIPISCFAGGLFGGILASFKKRKRK